MAERKVVKTVEAPVASANIRGIALAAMIVGIVGVVLCWLPFWGFVTGATALVLGIVSLVKRAPNHGMALAGTILGGAAIVLNIVLVTLFIVLAISSSNNSNSNDDSYTPPYYHYN